MSRSTRKCTRVFESEQRCVAAAETRAEDRDRGTRCAARIYNRDWDQKIETAPFLATPRFVLFEAQTAQHTLTLARRLLWLLLRERKWTSQTSAERSEEMRTMKIKIPTHTRAIKWRKKRPRSQPRFSATGISTASTPWCVCVWNIHVFCYSPSCFIKFTLFLPGSTWQAQKELLESDALLICCVVDLVAAWCQKSKHYYIKKGGLKRVQVKWCRKFLDLRKGFKHLGHLITYSKYILCLNVKSINIY